MRWRAASAPPVWIQWFWSMLWVLQWHCWHYSRFVVVHRLFYSLNITWSPWTRSLNHHWPDIVLIRFQCVMDVVNTWCHAHVNRLQRSSWLCLADVFSTNIVWCGARWMYGSGFSSRWEDKLQTLSGAAHKFSSANVVKSGWMSLSDWGRGRWFSKWPSLGCFIGRFLVLNQGQCHETVPFGPEKCWISQKIVLFLNQISTPFKWLTITPKNKTWSLPYTAF